MGVFRRAPALNYTTRKGRLKERYQLEATTRTACLDFDSNNDNRGVKTPIGRLPSPGTLDLRVLGVFSGQFMALGLYFK